MSEASASNFIDLNARPEGCHALLRDDGYQRLVPVCLGGTSIAGCNNSDACEKLYYERIDDPSRVHIIIMDESNKQVSHVATVPRRSIASTLLG